MNNCNNSCSELLVAPYRVVQNIQERNTIPCVERKDGMIVTVVNDTIPYTQYILKGGDPCINSNWKNYTEYIKETTKETVRESLLELIKEFFSENYHETVIDNTLTNVTNEYLNTNYGEKLEGFRVHFTSLGTTFTKIKDNVWVMTNNLLNKRYE